jgi:hypothetical protein
MDYLACKETYCQTYTRKSSDNFCPRCVANKYFKYQNRKFKYKYKFLNAYNNENLCALLLEWKISKVNIISSTSFIRHISLPYFNIIMKHIINDPALLEDESNYKLYSTYYKRKYVIWMQLLHNQLNYIFIPDKLKLIESHNHLPISVG